MELCHFKAHLQIYNFLLRWELVLFQFYVRRNQGSEDEGNPHSICRLSQRWNSGTPGFAFDPLSKSYCYICNVIYSSPVYEVNASDVLSKNK